MKTNSLLLAVVTLILAGCATTRVDWNARIGSYTFDQAVIELGPPDKQARLSDGRSVAEWVTRYQNGSSISIGTGYSRYGYPYGMGVVQTTGPAYYEHKLRLTFTAENVLASWSRN
jgi:hypothetical protein